MTDAPLESLAFDSLHHRGCHAAREACVALRTGGRNAIAAGIRQGPEVRRADPDRHPIRRLPRRVSARVGSAS